MRQIKSGVRRLAEPLARGLIRLGVSANAITLVGLLLNCVAGVIAAIGLLWLAGLCYLLFSSLDFLDGSVARLSGTANRFGAFFDSVLDRAAEAAVLIGLLYWYAGQQQPVDHVEHEQGLHPVEREAFPRLGEGQEEHPARVAQHGLCRCGQAMSPGCARIKDV